MAAYPPGPTRMVDLPAYGANSAPTDRMWIASAAVGFAAGAAADRYITPNDFLAEITRNISDLTLQFGDGVSGTVSAAGKGKIRYNNTAGSFQVSENGGAYQNLLKGSGTATRVAFWSAADELSSDAALYWQNTDKRLGIGVGTTPDGPLDVLADGTALAQQWRQNSGSMRVQMIMDSVPEASLGTTTNHTFHLLTNNLQRLTVENGGLVGINKASLVQAQLQVVSQDATTETLILNSAASPSVNIAEFYNDNSLRFAFSPAANLGIGLSGAGGATGSITFNGVTSGAVTMTVAAAAGTWTLTLPTTAGSAGQFLQTNGAGVTTWATAGGGTPASPVNSVQFNNAGAFGGSSNMLWDNTNNRLLLGVTVASGQAPLDVLADGTALAQQWRQNGGSMRVQMIMDSVPEASLGTTTNHTFHLLTNNLQRVTIENGGLVGINKASLVQAQLQVVSQDATTETLILNSAASPSVNIAEFYNDNSLRFAFSPAANLGIGLSGAGGATGSITFNGVTSGAVTMTVAAAAGTWTLTLPTTAGSAGQFLQTNGAGVTTWATAGGGTPGSPVNSIQFNNAGAFGGISTFTTDGAIVTMTRAGIGATSTDGIVLTNTTAAAAGAQQYSPRLRLTAQGWKTDATAESRTVDWIIENIPVQGSSNPDTGLNFSSQINAGGYSARIRMLATAGSGTSGAGNLNVLNPNGTNAVVTGYGRSFFGSNIASAGIASSPSIMLDASNTTISIRRGGHIGWSNSTGDASTSQDASFIASNAGVIRCANGGTGIASLLVAPSTASVTGNFTVLPDNAATATIVTVARLGVNSTGTAADGFGAALSWSAETSTTNDTETGRFNVFWSTATHASRTSALSFTLSNNASLAEVMRLTTPSATVGSPFVLNIHDGTNPNVWTSGSFAAKLYLISPTLPAVGVAAHFSATALDAPQWQMLRGRGTNASPTAVQNNDSIGNLEWWGQTSTATNNVVAGARIRVSATENWSAGNNGCQMIFYTSNNAGTITDRMYLKETGTVRIGATSGSYDTTNLLQVGNYASFATGVLASLYTGANGTKGLQVIGTNGATANLIEVFRDSLTPNLLTLTAAGVMSLRAGLNTGTTVARVGGTINENLTSTANSGSTETDLQTYSLPANTLGTDGDYLRIECWGTFEASVNNKTLKAKLGTSTLFDTGAQAFAPATAVAWRLTVTIVRTAVSGQSVISQFAAGGSVLTSTVQSAGPAENLASALTFKLTGQGGASNEIFQDGMVIQYHPNNL